MKWKQRPFKSFCQQLVLCMIMKINRHKMEICLEAFDEEDLLVAIILGLHVFCTYKLLN